MSIISLDDAKDWLRIDYDDEDDDIQLLMDTAEAYLTNATGKVFDDTNALAKLYCRILICDWYDNREMTQETKISEKIRYTIQGILLQLQYSS